MNKPHAVIFHFPSPYLLLFPTIKPTFTAVYKKDKLKQPEWIKEVNFRLLYTFSPYTFCHFTFLINLLFQSNFSYLFHCRCRVLMLHLITRKDTQSVALPWTRRRPVAAKASTCTTQTKETEIHAPGEIRTRQSSNRATADLRLRPHGHSYGNYLFFKWLNSQLGANGYSVLQIPIQHFF